MNACSRLNSIVSFKLDLVGLATLLGGNIVLSAMKARCLNSNRIDFTFYNVPGCLWLAGKIMACGKNKICKILAGGRESDVFDLLQMCSLCRFKASPLSAVQLRDVTNVVGESILLEYMSRHEYREYDWWKMKHKDLIETIKREKVVGIPGSHGITVFRLAVGGYTNSDIEFNSISCSLASCFTVLVNICSIAASVLLRQFFVLSIIFSGATINCLTTLYIKRVKFSLSSNIGGRSKNKILFTDTKTPNIIFIVAMSDNQMQTLFTKQLTATVNGIPLQLIVLSLMMYVNTVVSVIGIANVPLCGQVVFGVTVLAGAISELIRSGWDFRKHVTRYSERKLNVRFTKKTIFGNRLSAVASLAHDTEDIQVLKSMKLLPVNNNWDQFWGVIEACRNAVDINDVQRIIEERITLDVCSKMELYDVASDLYYGILSHDFFNDQQ